MAPLAFKSEMIRPEAFDLDARTLLFLTAESRQHLLRSQHLHPHSSFSLGGKREEKDMVDSCSRLQKALRDPFRDQLF